MRRRLHLPSDELAQLEELSPQLYREYLLSIGSVEVPTAHAAAVSDENTYQAALEEIRALLGLREFGRSTTIEQIALAAAPDRPLVYVNPSPWGTVIFIVGHDASVGVHFADDLESEALINRLGGGANGRPPYLLAVTGALAADDVGDAIDDGLAYVGTRASYVIAHALDRGAPRAATIVACGPISAVPIGANPWTDAGTERRLIDRYEIGYAASAILHRASTLRAAACRDQPVHLVALGNPSADAPLPAAEAEVAEIACNFGTESTVATGADATSAFLFANAAAATHLHMACHAHGNPIDFHLSYVRLADRAVTVDELQTIAVLRTRLTVASACQTAVPDLNEADEAQSLGTALLAAGSACVIASLWPVDDCATALLMARLYDELGNGETNPIAALRAAQLWLRGATTTELESYLRDKPDLAAELTRRHARVADLGRRGISDDASQAVRVFAHPDYWAAFIAVGS
jgi:CHAT domain-containing protein